MPIALRTSSYLFRRAEEHRIVFLGEKLSYFFYVICVEKGKVKYGDKTLEEVSQ